MSTSTGPGIGAHPARATTPAALTAHDPSSHDRQMAGSRR